MAKILSKSQGSISKVKCFFGQKSIFCHYYIQNAEDGIQARVYKIEKERVTHFSQFISGKVKKILIISQA